jgi:hypothetical protein
MACLEEELDQQSAQRSQEPQQCRLEREEGDRSCLTEAVRDDLVEPLMDLLSQLVACRWTGRCGRATLTGAHGDRLLTRLLQFSHNTLRDHDLR